MADDAFSELKPAQVAQTLRSLPRRVREALAQRIDHAAESFVHIVGSGGESVLDLLSDGASAVAVIDRALEQTLISSSPMVPAAVADPAARHFDRAPLSFHDVLELFDDTVGTLADRIDAVAPSDWLRSANLTGGGSVTADDIAVEGARTGVTMLRAVAALVVEVTA